MSERRGLKTILAFAVSLLALSSVYAQPKSLGASFSFSGFGLVYDHALKNDMSFLEVSLKAESAEGFLGRSVYPGVSVGFAWNMVIKEWLSREGNPIRLFAGPGVIAGYGPDHKSMDGVIIGLKGCFGAECSFARNAVISISLAPVIGSHIELKEGTLLMKYYRNGIQYALVPEIGIKYRFGK